MFSKIVSGGIEELRKIVPIGENTSDLIQFILPIILNKTVRRWFWKYNKDVFVFIKRSRNPSLVICNCSTKPVKLRVFMVDRGGFLNWSLQHSNLTLCKQWRQGRWGGETERGSRQGCKSICCVHPSSENIRWELRSIIICQKKSEEGSESAATLSSSKIFYLCLMLYERAVLHYLWGGGNRHKCWPICFEKQN